MARRVATLVMASLVAVSVAGGVVWAASDPVKERKALMEAIGKGMGQLAAIAKGEKAFDGKQVATAAQGIYDNLAKAAELFPKGSLSEDSRAKPEIWSDNATFMKGFAASKSAAQGLVKIGQEDDEIGFLEAMGGLGKTCKGCHEKFRKPKKQ